MVNITYLKLDEIIAIHYSQIESFGGSHGIRDFDLLLSAISRPQTTFGRLDLYPDIYTKASALIQSLILNHPFVDGNKRTALVSVIRFLRINGFQLNITNDEALNLPLNTNSKKLNFEEIAEWLKRHSEKI